MKKKDMYLYYDENGKIVGISNQSIPDEYQDADEMVIDISEVEGFIKGTKNQLDYVVANKNGKPVLTQPQEIDIPVSWKKYLRLYKPTTVMEDFDIFVDRNAKTIYVNLTDKFLKELEEEGTVYNLGSVGRIEIYFCSAKNYKYVYYSMSLKPGDLFSKSVEPVKYDMELPNDLVCMTKNIFKKTSFRIL